MSEEIVKIATVESRDASQETQKPIDLAELQQRRKDIQAALDSEISRIAEALSKRVPESARQFVQEKLGYLTTFVATISQHGSCKGIIDARRYDGKAAEVIETLKRAWSGAVDVEIVTRPWRVISLGSVEFAFKIPETKVGGKTAQD